MCWPYDTDIQNTAKSCVKTFTAGEWLPAYSCSFVLRLIITALITANNTRPRTVRRWSVYPWNDLLCIEQTFGHSSGADLISDYKQPLLHWTNSRSILSQFLTSRHLYLAYLFRVSNPNIFINHVITLHRLSLGYAVSHTAICGSYSHCTVHRVSKKLQIFFARTSSNFHQFW